MTGIITQEEGLRLIQDRIWSREWYVILGVDGQNMELAIAIETSYFQGENAKLFDLVMVPRPFDGCFMLGVFLAHKSVLDHDKVCKVCKSTRGSPGNDLLIVGTAGGIMAAEWLAATFTSDPPRDRFEPSLN